MESIRKLSHAFRERVNKCDDLYKYVAGSTIKGCHYGEGKLKKYVFFISSWVKVNTIKRFS